MIKRRNFLMFIVMFIFTFIGMNGVNAAKGLYCIYDDNVGGSYVMLVQDTSGNYNVYYKDSLGVVDDVIDYDTLGWYFPDDSQTFSFEDGTLGSLESCPGGADAAMPSSDELKFETSNLGVFGRTLIKKGDLPDKNLKSNSFSILSISSESDYIDVTDSKYHWLVEQLSDGYTNSCLYFKGNTYIQLDINYEKMKVRVSFARFTSDSVDAGVTRTTYIYTNYSFEKLKKLYFNACPNEIFYYSEYKEDDLLVYFSDSDDKDKLDLGAFSKMISLNLVESVSSISDSVDNSVIIKPNTITIENCEDVFGEDLLKILHNGVNAIKIVIPLLLIGLGIVDFAKAVFGGSEDNMKKSAIKFGKRVLIGIVIFFIPSILNIVLDIANKIWGNIDPSLCGIL